jgi:hypothetical protein
MRGGSIALVALLGCREAYSGDGDADDDAGSEGESDGDGDADADGDGEETVTLRGTVLEIALGQGESVPLEGVKVSLLDEPQVSAVTAADGTYELGGVPAGGVRWLITSDSASYYGAIRGADVGYADLEEIDLPHVRVEDIAMAIATLQMQDSTVEHDETRGAIWTASDTAGTLVDLDPMPESGNWFSLDVWFAAKLGDNRIDYAGYWDFVTYFNLAPGEAGAYAIVPDHDGEQACVAPLAEPPVLARHISYAQILCGG